MIEPASFYDLVKFHVNQQNRTPRRFSFLPTPTRVECAWCCAVLREGTEPVSHGICQPCRAQHFPLRPAQQEADDAR